MKKQKKLSLNRFKIAKLNNPKVIYGGTEGNNDGDTLTDDKVKLSSVQCLLGTN